MISLADSRNTGSFGWPPPITIARCFSHVFDWSVSFRNRWDTTHDDFHSLSVSDRHAPANQQSRPVEVAGSLVLSETDRCGFGVRGQPTAIFIRSPFLIGTLEPISGLVELKQLNLRTCQNLTGTICCLGTTSSRFHWLICRFTCCLLYTSPSPRDS